MRGGLGAGGEGWGMGWAGWIVEKRDLCVQERL